MKLHAGDWVQVRSKAEILATLDKSGRLERLPFMPQMFKYCGQRFQVYKRAHKTCDWIYTVKGRRVANAVHLELRCDGESYGGCQTACLIFWKEAWLRPVHHPGEAVAAGSNPVRASEVATANSVNASANCTEADVYAATRRSGTREGDEVQYVCQATQVMDFTAPLPWWDLRQYVEDYTSRNASLGFIVRALTFGTYNALVNSGIGIGRPMKWLYDRFQSLWGGVPYPSRTGTIPTGQPTPKPTVDPNLQPGELVRVRPYREILATLDTAGKNRGLSFGEEMAPYCEGTYRVRTRVTKFVDEKTGRFKTLKIPSFILEGVECRGRYSSCRLACPRSIMPWWREIWLERVAGQADSKGEPSRT